MGRIRFNSGDRARAARSIRLWSSGIPRSGFQNRGLLCQDLRVFEPADCVTIPHNNGVRIDYEQRDP